MKTRPKYTTLEAHIELRRRLADERSEAHGRGHVANTMFGVEREIARLDANILALKETIARLADEHKPQRETFRLWRFKVDVAVNDKKQLGELVQVLEARRDRLANGEGRRVIAAAKALASHLTSNPPALRAGEVDRPAALPAPQDDTDDDGSGGKWG